MLSPQSELQKRILDNYLTTPISAVVDISFDTKIDGNYMEVIAELSIIEKCREEFIAACEWPIFIEPNSNLMRVELDELKTNKLRFTTQSPLPENVISFYFHEKARKLNKEWEDEIRVCNESFFGICGVESVRIYIDVFKPLTYVDLKVYQ